MPSLKCRDIDMACNFEATAETEDELMKKIAEQASEAHNVKTISPEVMKKAVRKQHTHSIKTTTILILLSFFGK